MPTPNLMTKVPFNGQLNSNEILGAIYNMIISQQVFADNIKGGFGLVSKFKTDGTMFGDTKLYYATDVLRAHDWGNYSEAANLLSTDDRAKSPECQAITLNTFKQIRLVLDQYLSKRAWSDAGSFGAFQSVMMGWISKTKEVLDNTLINAYVGSVKTAAAVDKEGSSMNANLVNEKTIQLAANPDSIDDYALRGLLIGQGIADLLIDLQDYSRNYNSYGFLRNYEPGDFIMVFNAKYKNEIRKVDLPTVFHKDGIVDKLDEAMLPERYFGAPTVSADVNATTKKAATDKVIRSLVETDITIGSGSSAVNYHLFPGDKFPADTTFGAGQIVTDLTKCYTEDGTIICKLVHKDAIKWMSGFQVETEFFNPRSLTESHFLTYGYSDPDYLRNYPIITVKETN